MRRLMTCVLLTLSITTTKPVACGADHAWTGWLGPQRNGRVVDFQPPAQWPQKLTRVWQVTVGTGYGSPLVQNDRVYLHSRQDEDEVVWCFDLETGKVQWRKKYPAPFKMGGGGEWHGKGPKSSPVLSDGRLFTLSIAGRLSAWDTETGESLWHFDSRSKFENPHPYWGVSTSPLVDDGRVIVHLGSDDEGILYALNAETGQEVWTLSNHGASYSSPLVADIHGVRQIVEWNHETLSGVDIATGRLLWEYPFAHDGSNQNMPTPVVYQDCVLLSGENRGLHRVQPQRTDDGAWTVTKRWSQNKVALDMSSAVINNDLLFGFSHYGKGRLFCLDPQTGKVLWQSPGRVGENVMFLSIPGYVVALLDSGELQIIAADGSDYRKVAAWQVAESPTWAPPVLLQTGVLIKDKETLSMWRW